VGGWVGGGWVVRDGEEVMCTVCSDVYSVPGKVQIAAPSIGKRLEHTDAVTSFHNASGPGATRV
jgi:hypothetical protein